MVGAISLGLDSEWFSLGHDFKITMYLCRWNFAIIFSIFSLFPFEL